MYTLIICFPIANDWANSLLKINEKLFTTFSGKANEGIVSKYGQTD